MDLRILSPYSTKASPKPQPNASAEGVEKWHSDLQAKFELLRVFTGRLKLRKLDNIFLQSSEDEMRVCT